MQWLLRYLELVLTAAGVVVVAVVFAIFRDVSAWKAATIAAVAVGVLHGSIFFAVRAAQRRARRQAVRQIRETFENLIRNKLQVVLFAAEVPSGDWRPAAQRAVEEIQESLERIDAEPLRVRAK